MTSSSTGTTYSNFTVPVAGGDLFVGRWSGDGPIVLGVHGITANHLSWPYVVEALNGDVQFVAPDLRGRGGSGELPGPYGMAAHAADLVAVLDAVGVDRAVVVGHSMGGFVAVVMADLYPDRVDKLVLLDGGIPLPPDGLDLSLDERLNAVIGPAMARLSMTFPTRQAYLDFWRPHPALANWWSDVVESYLEYDIGGQEPELRSRVSIDAVRGDAADMLTQPTVPDAVENLKHPTLWLRAPRGLLNQVPPLYPHEYAAEVVRQTPQLTEAQLPDCNHYTLSLEPTAAKAVADHIRTIVNS